MSSPATTPRTPPRWLPRRGTQDGKSVDLFFEFSTLGLVLCGYLAMLSTGTLDLPTSVVVCTALLYRAVALFGFLPQRVPGWLLGTLTVVSIALYPADVLWWSGDFIQATVHLIFFLALLKLLSAQGNRDHLALLVLSFLLLVVAAVLSSDFLFFVFLLGFLTFSVMSFTSLELRRSLAVHRVVAAGARRLPLRLTLVSLLISGGILAMSLGLFYALPRSAKAALNQFLLQRPASSGFAREVVLGRFGELTQNPAVVMRIREIDLDRQAPAPPFPTHWRGATLTQFDGQRWSNPSQRGELTRIASNEIFLASPAQRRREGRRGGYEVHLSSQLGEFLFMPGLAEFLRIEQGYLFRYLDRTVRLPLAPKDDLEYAVFSYFDSEWELAEGRMASLSSTELGTLRGEDLLRLPPIDPRIEELARSVTEGYPNPLDKARILSSYLRGNYRYSLDGNRLPTAQPLSRFLFESRQGHCEYFASALAVMLRSIGIPSRVVTGFLATEYNPLTGWHVVRMSDAHSWVEVWLPDRGWFGFDPTPSTRRQPMSQLLARLRLWQDAIDTFWQDWVLAYDLGRQLTLAGSAEAASRGLREFALHAIDTVHAEDVKRLAGAASLALAAILLVLLLRRIWLRRRPSLRVVASSDEASRIYTKMLRSLASRGYAKPSWQTSTEFVHAVAGFPGMHWLAEFTQTYLAARYGGGEEALAQLRRLAAQAAIVPKR
ncbi:MAG: transglutaminaseTgpA domain-containing protein [Bryobacterales bacterium]|nr:transglutaminaseTgpA domain-containing protein [Bryobacterales bacterium]